MARKGYELTQVLQNDHLQGPTRAQARRMATYRQELLAKAQTALSTGNDDQAFDLDCHAFEIESDLRRYGFEKLV